LEKGEFHAIFARTFLKNRNRGEYLEIDWTITLKWVLKQIKGL
jgi:hypothetical protein